MEDFTPSRPGRRPRPSRRPERQQILLRRGLALGGGLLVLILIVLGVKGCLDARKERELSDYARNVSQIVEETEQTSKSFFGKLSDPGGLSVTEFINQVSADRSAMDNYASRVEGLSTPGDMGNAQNSLELVYELRAGAMNEIAEKMSTALGDVGSQQAMTAIAKQMRRLLASDELYAAVTRPEIDGVLADNGIEDSDVPKSVVLPDETKWLDEGEVTSALTVVSEGTPEVEVEVANQGGATENGIDVSVTVSGGTTLSGTIDSIAAGETQTVSIPLTPAPSGEATLEVEVATVPGEQISENNEASYTVAFE